ncbi:MAG TPA: hypothetical protein VGR62_24515 [Candidatus Binatia bacterium]|jgi:hypothetical protein|nr:hypothetical protein [Candidatus Binatia bacterium]
MRHLAVLGILLALVTLADAKNPLRKPKRGFQTRVGEYVVQPGEDLEVCEYRRLSNKKAMDVSSFALSMPPGAHHFAVWTYGGTIQDDSQFPAGPVESIGCTGVSRDDPFPQLLIPTQSPNTQLTFPDGVALRLEPHQQVWLNPHMKNFDAEATTPDIRFNLKKAKKGSVKHYAEGLTFGNSYGIRIPAGGAQTLTSEWIVPIDLTLIHITTHQHSHGTYANVELVAPDGSVETLVESRDWVHPKSVWPKGGIRLEPGRRLRVTCTWENAEDREVRFGPETTDEMCYGVGFFYRNESDATPVASPGCLPGEKSLLCPGVPSIASIRSVGGVPLDD